MIKKFEWKEWEALTGVKTKYEFVTIAVKRMIFKNVSWQSPLLGSFSWSLTSGIVTNAAAPSAVMFQYSNLDTFSQTPQSHDCFIFTKLGNYYFFPNVCPDFFCFLCNCGSPIHFILRLHCTDGAKFIVLQFPMTTLVATVMHEI